MLEPEKIRNRHQRDADEHQQNRVRHEIGESHQRETAEQWHDSPLPATIDDKAKSNGSEQHAPQKRGSAHEGNSTGSSNDISVSAQLGHRPLKRTKSLNSAASPYRPAPPGYFQNRPS